MSGFSWDDLQHFLAVARTGQLSAAARLLRTNHVTVSRRLDRLEKDLGVRLFERSPRGYMLTALGERLVERAGAIERDAAVFAEAATEGPATPRGTVRLATPEGFGNFFLADRLPVLARVHPALSIELVPIQQIVSLSRREADLSVALHSPSSGPYRRERIVPYRLFVYASRAYLEGAGPIAEAGALAAHPVIGYIEDMIFTPGLDYLREILPGKRASYQSSSIHAQLAATRQGLGLGVLPYFIASRHADLLPILPREVHIERDYWLICHDDLVGAPRIRLLSDFIRDTARAAADTFAGAPLLS
ncbi:LysR family transcriptional regulator [Aureimonas flava]|uniref:LysR family transcriptional regulator n=1 Tax=Aureimonas flava TaxID=2320271 RepID=A0A3A1WKM8_9HYPH|nr:LysR family transcriptional regulator [Aureimonas flava]RIY00852.1 LysR family transcriptional regulator [Aureimonas flava]